MGMFDALYSRYPLPGLGIVDDEFQSRDTPRQLLDTYEIRTDGSLWRQEYDVVDKSDPKSLGPGRIAGMCARENLRWEREYLSGIVCFYADRSEGWVEFEAEFRDGVLHKVQQVAGSTERGRPRLVMDPHLPNHVRATEREACALIVEDRAREAEEGGDQVLGLILRTLALHIRRQGDTQTEPSSL